MNKKAVIIFLIIIVIFLCGCNSFENVTHNREIKKEQGRVSEKIMEYIKDEDKDSLYDLFAPVNKDNCDIHEQLDGLFSKYPVNEFDFNNVVKSVAGQAESIDDGRITYYSFGYSYEGIVDKDGKNYRIDLGYIVEDKDKGRIGITSLNLSEIKIDDPEKPYQYEVIDKYEVGNSKLF